MALSVRPIREFMTRGVQTVEMAASLRDALTTMRQSGVRHLPVLDEGTLVGVVSQRDLEILEAHRLLRPGHATVADAMSPGPYTVGLDEPLHAVVRTMAANKYGAAVVAEGRTVYGIFTTTDALRLVEHELA
ncbi:MAG: CBS domain-containing protein [Myxococcales bacterium FL481]|nr:MAG: CBS domain-containing protein [Myxococcales bacterium FL481]